MANDQRKLAVLIDIESLSPKFIPHLLQEIAKCGTIDVLQVYADHSKRNLGKWKAGLSGYSFTVFEQVTHNKFKRFADGTLIIAAMDLLHKKCFDAFCIVTGSTDYTRLATRIREEGVTVYGFGRITQKQQTFIAACDKFIELQASEGGVEQPVSASPVAKKPDELDTITDLALSPETTVAQESSNRDRVDGDGDINLNDDREPDPAAELQLQPDPESYPTSPQPIDANALKIVKRAIRLTKSYTIKHWKDVTAIEASLSDPTSRPCFRLSYRAYGYSVFYDFLAASGQVKFRTVPAADGGRVLLAKLLPATRRRR